MIWLVAVLAGVVLIVAAMAVYDLVQTRHAIRRNFPVIGRLRYVLERIGPELRQYIVTDNDEERPFTRDQRRWVYSSAKRENPYFGFGTDNHLDQPQYVLVRHSPFPFEPGGNPPRSPEDVRVPVAKVMGEWRNRPGSFRPGSVVAISAMSYGSLSGPAVEALNRGAALAGALQNTGEGGISPYHLNGGDLIYQLGTGYFGSRHPDGRFDLDRLVEQVERAPVRAIEIKLSQGAKPGLGGVLPGEKVTAEIAAIRGCPQGQTVRSPARHSTFDSVPTMIDFIEEVADATGLPVGIKSAVGQRAFWSELAETMDDRGEGPDFITIDGGEGGTGAAPLVFSDHVSLPFRPGFAEVFATFAQRGLHEKVLWVGSGKLGLPDDALVAMALGVDMLAVAREAMLAAGCIQAQKCQTGHCPTGVATQSPWLMRGLDPTDKSVRVANYLRALRFELLRLAHACGQPHPAGIAGDEVDLMQEGDTITTVWDRYGYRPEWRKGHAVRLADVALLTG
ncbi:MAG: FMN-binding glutamate synthase family protein [Acidimicrobiales bacterium]